MRPDAWPHCESNGIAGRRCRRLSLSREGGSAWRQDSERQSMARLTEMNSSALRKSSKEASG